MTKDKKFLKKELGERLRSALKAKNIKFMDVARDLGVSPQVVTFWLKGQKDPAFSNIALIAQKYGLNPVYLLLGEGPPFLPKDNAGLKDNEESKEKDVKKAFGQRIKNALKAAGFRGVDIAKDLGVAENTVSQWFQGKREPKLEIIKIFTEKYGVNPYYILAGKGPPLLLRGDKDLLAHTPKRVSKEDEEVLLERYRYLITALGCISEPPQTVFGLSVDTKVPNFRKCIFAIWRFYWALVLDREPLSEDLATIAALYYRSRDALPAAKKLINELKKDWRIEPEVIEKENFPFNPKQSEKIEPNTLKFLRFATKDLIDLYKQKNLPSVCLVHHKVHWAGCPVCEKGKQE